MNEEVAEFLVAQDIYEQADAMIDLIYFALGTLVEMGLEADELFDIVQKANMAKLWSDGKPHYNPKDARSSSPTGGKIPPRKSRPISMRSSPARRRNNASESRTPGDARRFCCEERGVGVSDFPA